MSDVHEKNNLAAFLHGELDENAAYRVAAHLSQCEECRAEFEDLKLGDDLAKNLLLKAPSESVWTNIQEKLSESASSISTQKKRPFPGSPNSWRKFSYAVAAVLLIAVGVWWFQDKNETRVVSVNFDEYLSKLESQPRESFPQAFAVVPSMFEKVDSTTAHVSVGMKRIGEDMAALGYRLFGNRLRRTSKGNVAQFIYGNANEVIAVFAIPKSVKCEFGTRSVESAQLEGFSYARVASRTVSTLWLNNDRHQLVFITLIPDEKSMAPVLRLFVQ
jgi:anti-sigma factor RsiW